MHYNPFVLTFLVLTLLFSCKHVSEENTETNAINNEISLPDVEDSKATPSESLKEVYEELLKTGAIDKEQFDSYMEGLTSKNKSEHQVGDSSNTIENGSSDIKLQGQMKEYQEIMKEPDMKMRQQKMQQFMAKQKSKKKMVSKGELAAQKKTENIRNLLETSDNSFIEENITRYSIWGSPDKKESLNKLETASKAEANIVLADYFGISQKELDLLRPLPSKQKIMSELDAQQIAKHPLPEPIEVYLKSGQASSKFKAMMTSRKNDMIIFAGDVIKASAKARKEFYKKNPSWYGEGEDSGNTYRDSRDKFIYLPLGDLSFADNVISHLLGSPTGGNTLGSIGVPDMFRENFSDGDPKICNIGINGVLTLEFTNNAIIDVNGPDIYIFEMGAIEPTLLEISKDGNTWIQVGQIKGGTAMVDISASAKPGETYTLVRLTDLNTPSELPGADVDAVAAIGGAMRLNLDSSLLFDTGKYQLKESALQSLKRLVSEIQKIPKGLIKVEGHTDNVGNPNSNKSLSENRAKEVSNYLKKNLSSHYTFQVNGFGETQPIKPNDTEENKQRNRRVEILVIPTN
jgi:outer membrane protein OmpA-like peptidoglycan-associated protein